MRGASARAAGEDKDRTQEQEQKRGAVQDALRKDASGWVSTFCVSPGVEVMVLYRCNFTRRTALSPLGPRKAPIISRNGDPAKS
jgi:hypothetical protein